MSSIETVLITGANAGLGKDSARQLALMPTTKKVYLGCRNEQKAIEAKRSLEETTGKKIFEIVIIDTSDLDSVRAAVASLSEPLDGLIMNAGGPGGPQAGEKTGEGVLHAFSVNVLGHVVLVDELIAANKLTQTAVYVSTEAARGIPVMGMARPALKSSSVDDFVAIADGSMFAKFDPMVAYGLIKYTATMWMSSMARRHPKIRFVSVSPGATSGTNAADQVGAFQKFVFTKIAYPMLTLFGRAHGLEQGAKRYVDVLIDDKFESGHFYASAWPGTSGGLVDQGPVFEDLKNEQFQDNAYIAIRGFLESEAQEQASV